MQATAIKTTTEQAPIVRSAVNVRRALSALDIQDLHFHATEQEREANHAGGGMSVFAAMCEAIALFRFGSRNCRRCGGTKTKAGRGFIARGKRTSYDEQLRRYRRRMMQRDGISVTMTEEQAEALRATGLDAFPRHIFAEMYPELPALLCKECPNCKGRGVIARATRDRKRPLTARPTTRFIPNVGSSLGRMVDPQDVIRRARVDERLVRVHMRCPDVRDVLTDYYGQSRKLIGKPAALLVLWRRTNAGKQLLKIARRNADELDDRVFFGRLLREHKLVRNRNLAGLLERADREAQQLLDIAHRAWNAVGPRQLAEVKT